MQGESRHRALLRGDNLSSIIMWCVRCVKVSGSSSDPDPTLGPGQGHCCVTMQWEVKSGPFRSSSFDWLYVTMKIFKSLVIWLDQASCYMCFLALACCLWPLLSASTVITNVLCDITTWHVCMIRLAPRCHILAENAHSYSYFHVTAPGPGPVNNQDGLEGTNISYCNALPCLAHQSSQYFQ